MSALFEKIYGPFNVDAHWFTGYAWTLRIGTGRTATPISCDELTLVCENKKKVAQNAWLGGVCSYVNVSECASTDI